MDGDTGESSSADVGETVPLRQMQSSTSASWMSPETGDRPPPMTSRYQAVCRAYDSRHGAVNGCSKETTTPIYGVADCAEDDEDDYDDEYDDVIDQEKTKRRRKTKKKAAEHFGLRMAFEALAENTARLPAATIAIYNNGNTATTACGCELRLRDLTGSGKGRELMSRKRRHHDREIVPEDEEHSSFFAKGRDFGSVYTNHKYTAREREILASHDSFDYLPSHSDVYKQWLTRQPSRLDWDRWLMMGLIGVSIGLVGFFLHQVIHLIAEIKWQRAEHYIHENNLLKAWAWVLGYSVLLTTISSFLVAFVYQPAGGSGIPEVIGFLNGTVMHHVLNLPAFCVKFFSCSCAVGAGMPVGPEAPMIHIGSIVGTGISQCRSRTLNFTLPFFSRFRNSEDRRNFTTAGAAAGVAAAFGAPVGGLLFAMEEVSSFWSMKLGWMIFFCCMLATFTADIFNSSFDSFQMDGQFGMFQTDKFIIFKLGNTIPVNVIMFLPAALLGFIGGILGAVFTIGNLKVSRIRRRLIARVKQPLVQNILRCLEPPLIMTIWATITVFLPSAFPCKPMVCPRTTQHAVNNFSAFIDTTPPVGLNIVLRGESLAGSLLSDGRYNHDGGLSGHETPLSDAEHHRRHGNGKLSDCYDQKTVYAIDDNVQQYWCQEPRRVNGTIVDGEYNEVASLLNVHGQRALRLLFSRRSHYQFGYLSLLTILPIYFVLACWASGSALASGIVVPKLFIGGLYGRVIGRLLVDLHGGIPTSRFWKWIDPGAMALIGAASFFGGVSRLTMSLTVIMIEITNDVAFLLPIMVAIMVSKWVGDYITHPLYHSLLELKCIPFLDSEPIVYNEQHQLLNLELFKARDVMQSPVVTINLCETIAHLAHVLLETTHGGYPVVKYCTDSQYEVAFGILTRTELCVILCHEKTRASIASTMSVGLLKTPVIPYEELSVDMFSNKTTVEILENYVSDVTFQNITINIEPYVNRSAARIDEDFSLHRTYIVFRTLGLRHLTVVDAANRVVGIITRKDLMGFNLEERLEQRKRRGYSVSGGVVRLLPSEQGTTVDESAAVPSAEGDDVTVSEVPRPSDAVDRADV